MLSKTKPSNIQQTRAKVEALRLALLSPTAEEVALALPGLEEAARYLAMVEQEVRDGASRPHEFHCELKLLKNDLRISVRLIENGIAFCRGWAKMLGAGPEYTQTGQAAPVQSEGTLSLHG